MPVIYSDNVQAWGLEAIAHVRNVPGCELHWPYAESEGGIAASLQCELCNVWFTLRADGLHANDPITQFVRQRLQYRDLRPPYTALSPHPLYLQPGRIELLTILRDQAGRGLLPGEPVWSEQARLGLAGWEALGIDVSVRERPTAWERLLMDDD
jgi:hypothetical protein